MNCNGTDEKQINTDNTDTFVFKMSFKANGSSSYIPWSTFCCIKVLQGALLMLIKLAHGNVNTEPTGKSK